MPLSLLNTLNEQQRQAVECAEGSILVIAGAGSGKTRVITTRIAWLIKAQQEVPHSIVALTFTNKAALEMKERIEDLLEQNEYSISKPIIGTFHGYCLQLLRTYGSYIGLEKFSILDGDDQRQLVQKILKRNNIEKQLTAKAVLNYISSCKNSMNSTPDNNNRILKEVFAAYEKEKELNKALDFDDLLVKAYQLFSTSPQFKSFYQSSIRHILVDEYQDTNLLQHALLKQMALTPQGSLAVISLCVVGDDDQSIYSWRGATVTNILEFSEHFPQLTFIKVEQNYRSAQRILDVANTVIECNQQRNPKKLWSGKEGTNCVALLSCLSSYQEGDSVAHLAKAARKNNDIHSIAILYRAHHQSRILEEALIRASIPYTIIGGIQFYERKEIKDLLAYLRLIANPFDRLSCARVINCPSRGLGTKFEELLLEVWDLHPFATFEEVARILIEQGEVTGKKGVAFEEFVSLVTKTPVDERPLAILEKIIQRTRYFTYLAESYDRAEAESKIDNVKELLRAVAHFEQQGMALDEFLHEVALIQDKSHAQEAAAERVFLMTCHAAKGLEFDMVLLTGLEDGVFPGARATYNENDVEEERRLFYVGITRAKKRLLITHARYRYTYGSMTEQTQSRFLKEIPKELLVHHDISNLSGYQIQSLVEQWITNKVYIPPVVSTFGKRSSY